MPVARYLHAAVLVQDLEQAEHFYGTVLGLSKVSRDLRFPGAWYQIGEVQIHLIVDAEIRSQQPARQAWGRGPHLALGVDDLEAIKDDLMEQGYPVQLSASGRAALFVRDPDGNVIEISQLSSDP